MPNIVEKVCESCGTSFSVSYKLRAKMTCSKDCSYKLRMKKRKETQSSTVGIQKSCQDCGKDFLDPTRKVSMQRCKDCTEARMVRTRRENGTYAQSDERRKWQSEMLKQKYAEGWNPNTLEHREKLSKKMKERWENGKMRQTIHWSQTEVGKASISIRVKGRKLSDEARHKMSLAASKRILEGKRFYHRGRGGVRDDLGFYVRSSWEANFARVLVCRNEKFEYESQSFTLESGKTYIPDFKVGDCYYEIKGYMTQAANDKLREFREQYPDIELKIIGPNEYNELYSVYGGLVNWE